MTTGVSILIEALEQIAFALEDAEAMRREASRALSDFDKADEGINLDHISAGHSSGYGYLPGRDYTEG